VSHRDGYSKAVKDAARKIRKRTATTPAPTCLSECIPGDVVIVPELGHVRVMFHQRNQVAIRQWGPPTRDRTQRQRIQIVAGEIPVEVIGCECKGDQGGAESDCPECDGSGVIGLWY
jgi:hypothetical protein